MTRLTPLGHERPELKLESLTRPQLFVPRLADKPQNPIVEILNAATTTGEFQIQRLPPKLDLVVENIPNPDETTNAMWFDAAKRTSRSRIMSWDALRSYHGAQESHLPFLSEQDTLVFAASQYNVQPRIQDPTLRMIHVKLSDLFESLRMTVLGNSSVLHTWNKLSETFIQSGAQDGTHAIVSIDRKDGIISRSFLQRFLTIGTLLRRIEIFIHSLRSRSARDGPTIHAFTHSLSTMLVFLRDALSRSPLYESSPTDANKLVTIWMHYAEFEDILLALSILCSREEEKLPSAYSMLDASPAHLLSRVYDQLRMHIERHSPRAIIVAFAYILSTTSQDYFGDLCQSVGFGANPLKGMPHILQAQHDLQLSGLNDEDDTDDRKNDSFEEEQIFPTFFPTELAKALPTAKQSLKLLQVAHPKHPLLTGGSSTCGITWIWSEGEVAAALNNRNVVMKPSLENPASSLSYKADLAAFCVFDLEPGSHLAETAFTKKSPNAWSLTFDAFIATFPASITPSLELVTSLTFTPLLEHAASLSSALLSLFLSPSHLNFQAHLTLLRSYLLLTSDSFKSRLALALFSDSEAEDPCGQHVKLPIGPSGPANGSGPARSWVIGLSPALTHRETWPPGGADLSFFLRTVIVDSLELGHSRVHCNVSEESPRRGGVFEEAEYRLGFAIRDLPVGTGKKRWLDPLSIEALDFLYLDYKPPHPLEVLISPEILSKYQRIFAFILRVMRVKHAVCVIFRMTRKHSKPLFATLASSNKLLMHFRFIAHSFVNSLSEYVFDTAIGGHFDPFLSYLSSGPTDNGTPKFTDVFSLAKYHSSVLDDILNACLLRSGQKAVGDLLRHLLEVILDFSILTGNLSMGRLEEYQAAPRIEDLLQKFRGKMMTLTMVLKSLAEKGPTEPRTLFEQPMHRRQGGTEDLYNLLIRLDLGDWWSKTKK